MGLMHQSIATINSPEFINLQALDINPLMSSCQIKVLYIGENRNRSYISKQVATQMAKSLRGAPIVGYYKKDKEDFADHGEQLILDDEGFHFNCLTKPYGFVSPDAKVWFQDFEDKDDFGNSIIRTYLMTTGYLWTSQFQEAQKILNDNGKPQSMELDEKSLKGKWSTNIKEGIEFFIINDAIFSKLCILGDDVEPCFEGAAITKPQISTSFNLDENFKNTLFKMMQELTYALQGGNKQVKDIKDENLELQKEENFSLNEEEKNFVKDQDKKDEASFEKNEKSIEDSNLSEFEKKEEQKQEQEQNDNSDSSQENEDEKDKKEKYNLLKQEYDELQNKFNLLNNEIEELRAFKKNIENKEKDDLINQFYMLSDEDKKDVIENKDKYSFEEIESKLAVICFKKKVNFNLEDSFENDNSKKETEKVITTFNINTKEDSTPDWIKAVESTMNKI